MTYYTLIAYRPNGYDSYRGSTVSTSDSKFEFLSVEEEDLEQLFKAYTRLLLEEYENYKYEEICNYEYIFLINGIIIDDFDLFECEMFNEDLDKCRENAKFIWNDKIVKEQELKEKQEQENKNRLEKIEKEQYELLKKKYGG